MHKFSFEKINICFFLMRTKFLVMFIRIINVRDILLKYRSLLWKTWLFLFVIIYMDFCVCLCVFKLFVIWTLKKNDQIFRGKMKPRTLLPIFVKTTFLYFLVWTNVFIAFIGRVFVTASCSCRYLKSDRIFDY